MIPTTFQNNFLQVFRAFLGRLRFFFIQFTKLFHNILKFYKKKKQKQKANSFFSIVARKYINYAIFIIFGRSKKEILKKYNFHWPSWNHTTNAHCSIRHCLRKSNHYSEQVLQLIVYRSSDCFWFCFQVWIMLSFPKTIY